MANQLIASDGAITSRTKGLRESVARNATQQERLEARVAATEQRLLKQYATLDTVIAQTSAANSALSQSLAALAAQSRAFGSR